MELESGKVTFQLPENVEDEKESCYVVNFSNGQLRPSAQSKPKFTLYQKAKDHSRKKRLVVAETDHMTYIGTNYDPDTSIGGPSGTKYCIGEFDREKRTITLHKTELITLKPFIPGKTDASEEVSNEATPARSKVSLDHVVSTFGSEKQKKRYSAAKRNRLETDALETALATAVAHVQNEADKEEAAPLQSSGIMPLHNPLAERPQDVYNLEDILSLTTLRSLKKAAHFLKGATQSEIDFWREEKRYPEYVLEHISSLPTTEPQSSLKAAILLGLACLMKLHNTTVRAFQKTGLELKGVELPDNVREELLEKFTERQQTRGRKFIQSLSARMKDKIRLHLFVLALILDDFTVQCLSLQQDLTLSCARIMDHFKALGCAVSKRATKRKSPSEEEQSELQAVNTCTAVLKIPLNFPKPRSQKKAKKVTF